MFMHWWCSRPEAPLPPLVRRFGMLVDQYYPAA
jgi:hypothetical protein